MNWYYKLLANRPYLVLVAVAVFSIACMVVAATFQKFPDFSDPTLGFEARGTIIGQRLTAWRNLLEETRPSGMLIANPNEMRQFGGVDETLKSIPRLNNINKSKNKKIKYRKKIKILKDSIRSNKTDKLLLNFSDESDDNITQSNENRTTKHWNYGKNLSFTNNEEYLEKIQINSKQWKLLREQNPPASIIDPHLNSDGFFCGPPNPEYAHFVVQRIYHNLTESLFEINALLAMCDLEYQIERIDKYQELCERGVVSVQQCCRPWSLPNYIALLSNKTSCFDIENEDVVMVKSLLIDCFEYYHSLKLGNDCVNTKCPVPVECEQHNAIYNIFHYMINAESINLNSSNLYLIAGMIFVPIARSSKALPLFYNIEKESLSNELVSIVAMDMGLKNAYFDRCILADGWLIGVGCLFIMTCMWIYTKSFFITIMTLMAILFSLGIAYFIYTLLLELPFFPFMNLLAVVILVGIGADDVFIFVKIWNCSIAERVKSLGLPIKAASITTSASYPETLAGLIAVTLKHAALSMLVTTLTTAFALYTSVINSITAIRCFGIFAGTAVLSNYLLMVTWLPASVSLVERISCEAPNICKQTTNSVFTSINRAGTVIEDFLISIVINMPKFWIFLLGTLGILSGLIVFYWPKLRLPDSADFKMFTSDHPFEIYDSQFKNMFWFEKLYTDSETFKLPIRFVWGVQAIDNGNYLDPTSRGDLYLDNNFNISSIESQVWLLNFCKEFKQQPFYQFNIGPPMLPNCFIENFIRTMERRCMDNMSGIDRTPCCEISQFPYPPDVFNECLPQIISILYESPRYIFIPGIAGPKFLRDSLNNTNTSLPLVKALVVEYESTQPYTISYRDIDRFQKTVEKWFNQMLTTAPNGMQNAWFISELEFFDLQDTLSKDTIYAMSLAMVVSLLILLIVTLNLLISLYAIVTVTLTVLTTVAILVLMDWKLNILESISISTTIGLAVDFSLHYGLQYRMCTEMEREPCTRYALSRMIGPTGMAALTTGAAGAFMMPSNVLAYIQIGKLLIIVMSVSWLYATLFLMSLLRVFGPQYGFGQFKFPTFQRKRENRNGKSNLQPNNSYRSSTHETVSEQLLSASSSVAGEILGSESHELSSLTSNSIVKSATPLETRPISFERVFRKRQIGFPKENSPTSISAITEVLPDDCDIGH